MLKLNVTSEVKDMRMLYTTAEGGVLKNPELMDSIREKYPDIECLAETKRSVEDNFKIP